MIKELHYYCTTFGKLKKDLRLIGLKISDERAFVK